MYGKEFIYLKDVGVGIREVVCIRVGVFGRIGGMWTKKFYIAFSSTNPISISFKALALLVHIPRAGRVWVVEKYPNFDSYVSLMCTMYSFLNSGHENKKIGLYLKSLRPFKL